MNKLLFYAGLAGLLVLSRGLLSYLFGGYSNFVVLLAFIFPVGLMIGRNKINRPVINIIFVSILLYLIYLFFLISKAEGVLRAFVGLSLLGFYFVLPFTFAFGVKLKNNVEIFKIINCFMCFFFMYLTFFCAVEFILDTPISKFLHYPLPKSMGWLFPKHRMTSSIGSTLPFSVTYSYFVIFMFSKSIHENKIKYYFFSLIGLIILFGAYNRGGIGMTVIGMFIVYFRRKRIFENYQFSFTRRDLLQYIGLFILAIIFVAVLLPEEAINRFLAIFEWKLDKSNLKRFDHWVAVFETFRDWKDWLFGRSIGSTGNTLNYFNLPPLIVRYGVTESYYLKVFLEMGLIGLILFVFVIISNLKVSFNQKVKLNAPHEASIKSFIFAALFAQSIQFVFLQSLESTSVAFMFFLITSFNYFISTKT